MSDAPYLGLDLGGTNIQGGVVVGGKVLARDSTKTRSAEGSDAVIKRIVKLCDELVEKSGFKKGDVAGLGIGAPGAVDHRTGTVIKAVNLSWEDYPLAEVLGAEVRWPVTVDNDVNVAAWGEYRAGAARKLKKVDSLLAVWCGTGVGGGLVLNDALFHGACFTAGEIGHTIVRSGAGRGRRTLEDLAGRKNLVAMLTRLMATGHASAMGDIVGGDFGRIRSKALAAALDAEDPLTTELLKQAATAVGHAVASTVTLLSLPAVVLGGGVSDALGDRWAGWVRDAFHDAVFPEVLRDTEVLVGELGDDAGVIGSALLAQERGPAA